MDVLLHNLIECEYKTHSKRKKLYADTGYGTKVDCFRRVLPSCVNTLGYLRVWQTTILSQHSSLEEEQTSHTPGKTNDI